jgi:hypothetical protein
VGEKKRALKSVMDTPEENSHSEGVCVDDRIILK